MLDWNDLESKVKTDVEASSDSAELKLTVVEESPGKKYRVEVGAAENISRGTLVELITLRATEGISVATA